MKVAFCYRHLILGGVCTQLANRLTYLKDYISPYLIFVQNHGGVHVFRGCRDIFVLPTHNERVKFFKKNTFDIIIVIDTPEFYDALAKARVASIVINEVHTTTTNLKYLGKLRKSTTSMKLVRELVAPSKYLCDRIKEEFKFEGVRPITHQGNCIDISMFDYYENAPVSQKTIILWVGKIDDHKNWEDFLRIAGRLIQDGFHGEFWLVGGQTAPEEKGLKLFSMMLETGVMDQIRWLCQVDYKHMPGLYSMVAKSGGCTVITSRNESFGMTAAEAMACKCPVVATDVGALSELVIPDKTGMLFDLYDIGAGVRCVQNVLDDKELRQKFIDNSYEKIRTKYSIEVAGSNYLRFLQNLGG